MKLLESTDVCDLLGISKSTLYRWVNIEPAILYGVSKETADTLREIQNPTLKYPSSFNDESIENLITPQGFPKPYKIGRAYKWNSEEIFAWLETCRI